MGVMVMAHGAFCGGWAFDGIRADFEAAGWEVITPDLRGHAQDDPAAAVSGVSMADYAADLTALCNDLDAPPVLLGHSMGGLAVQMAARRARVRALVLLAPSAPWGVAGGSFEEAATALGVHMMGAFSSGAVDPDLGLMATYTLDRLPPAQRQAILQRLRPESSLATRQALNWWLDPFMTTSIGPGPLPVPTLAIAGQHDLVHPPATVRQIAARIGAAFEVAPAMSHWLMDGPGAERVVATILSWLRQEARPEAAA